jgi:hypothetical protein
MMLPPRKVTLLTGFLVTFVTSLVGLGSFLHLEQSLTTANHHSLRTQHRAIVAAIEDESGKQEVDTSVNGSADPVNKEEPMTEPPTEQVSPKVETTTANTTTMTTTTPDEPTTGSHDEHDKNPGITPPKTLSSSNPNTNETTARPRSSDLPILSTKYLSQVATSKFLPPVTPFTDHVMEIVTTYSPPPTHNSTCDLHMHFILDKPNTIPRIECTGYRAPSHGFYWCPVVKYIFQNKTLPNNVSIGFSAGDFYDINQGATCLANSNKKGLLCVPNMEEIAMMDRTIGHWHEYGKPQRGIRPVKPWEDRERTPVFRGTAWWPDDWQGVRKACVKNVSDEILLPKLNTTRYKAVMFSQKHPDLLNARFHEYDLNVPGMKDACYPRLNKTMPEDSIPSHLYYHNYQTALVLNGIGAAFRLTRHFEYQQAVILQAYKHEEWFTKYLLPWVHYVPVAEDLSDLQERLEWVRDHSEEMRVIAENGRKFFLQHLTFEMNGQHIYELVYRLSEHNKGEYKFPAIPENKNSS